MLGGRGWQFQWTRVQWRLDGVRAVYTGREGGTESALDATLSFFEAAHHLKDWLGNDPSSGITKADGDSLISRSPMLKLCADLANGSKHLVLTSTRTNDKSTGIARNDVNICWERGRPRIVSMSSRPGRSMTFSTLPKALLATGSSSSPIKDFSRGDRSVASSRHRR
jgi:hypothetical protein